MRKNIKKVLLSVTFRQLSVKDIIDLAKNSGLDGIEWGGDKHVIPTDTENAQKVAIMMKNSGLETVGYGSYFQVGINPIEEFQDVIKVTKILEAPIIRVWAGNCSSNLTNDKLRNKIIEEAKIIATLAKENNIKVGLEYHDNTLTDTLDSTKRLIFDEINHENLFTYWQVPVGMIEEDNLLAIDSLNDKIIASHIFAWDFDSEKNIVRLNLSEHSSSWIKYIEALSKTNCSYIGMEFVKNDDIEEFKKDAITLNEIVY